MNHTLRIYTRTTHGCLEPQLFLSNLLASACLLHIGIRRLIPQQDVHYSMVQEGVLLFSSENFDNQFNVKVEVLWEGLKILQNCHVRFDVYYIQSNIRWRFCKSLWPFQNILTLKHIFLPAPFQHFFLFKQLDQTSKIFATSRA